MTGPVKSASRCLDLLELFATHRDGLTLAEVCASTGWPKSSTLSLIRTLHSREYLVEDSRTRAYGLGQRVAWLAGAYLAGLSLVQAGQAVIRDVSRRCDETVHLAILQGRDVMYVAKEEGTSHMRMVSAVGRRIPAHGTGIGKVLLSRLSRREFDQLFPDGKALPALTDATVTDREQLWAQLERIRGRGFAFDNGESTVGLNCIAAPVYDHLGNLIAAMSVSVPGPRFTQDRVPELRTAILQGARTLSTRLGCQDTPTAFVSDLPSKWRDPSRELALASASHRVGSSSIQRHSDVMDSEVADA